MRTLRAALGAGFRRIHLSLRKDPSYERMQAATASRTWSNEELTLALALYYQLQFGSLHQRNPAVIALAAHLHRTAAALALKLVNLASLDPTVTESGRTGMRNASNADRAIFRAYQGRWDDLATLLPEDVATVVSSNMAPNVLRGRPAAIPARETVRPTLVDVRRGQSFFRNAVLASYRHRCCVSAVATPELLRASHIIPWAADASARLDPSNGLCLNALYDAAFDVGLMTLDEQHRVLFSKSLRQRIEGSVWDPWFRPFDRKAIELPERLSPRKDALKFHRESRFIP